MQPLHDRVLVGRLPAELVSKVLWIPDIAMQNSQRAKVLAMGKECYGFKVGDTVLLPGVVAKYPDWESCDLMLIQQADIGGILG